MPANDDTNSLPSSSRWAGQVLRFALTGGAVAVLYIATTTAISGFVGAPFQVALVIGFSIALLVHFSLQRVFVWAHDDGFALPVRRQIIRYLGISAAVYALTALSTATLPGILGVPVILVYLSTAATLTVLNFLVFRGGIFHSPPLDDPSGAPR